MSKLNSDRLSKDELQWSNSSLTVAYPRRWIRQPTFTSAVRRRSSDWCSTFQSTMSRLLRIGDDTCSDSGSISNNRIQSLVKEMNSIGQFWSWWKGHKKFPRGLQRLLQMKTGWQISGIKGNQTEAPELLPPPHSEDQKEFLQWHLSVMKGQGGHLLRSLVLMMRSKSSITVSQQDHRYGEMK